MTLASATPFTSLWMKRPRPCTPRIFTKLPKEAMLPPTSTYLGFFWGGGGGFCLLSTNANRLLRYGQSLVTFDPKAEAKLRLKIDLYVVPTVALLYLFCFIDRANIGKWMFSRYLTLLFFILVVANCMHQ